MSLASLAATILGAAHDFVSPYLPGAGTLRIEEDSLQEYVRHELQHDHGQVSPVSPGRRVHFCVDDALADLVDEECDRVGMDYSSFIRAILRRAMGYPVDVGQWPTQGHLELEGVAS